MPSGKKSKQARRNQSRLQDHKRKGKAILQPPMRTIPNTNTVPWLRDIFPDMLWICATLQTHGTAEGMKLVALVLDRIGFFLPHSSEAGTAVDSPLLTGTLTSFDLVPPDHRQEVLTALQADGLYEKAFPQSLTNALARYHDLPGAWVFGGWGDDVPNVPDHESEKMLQDVVLAAPDGQSSLATKSKAMVIITYLVAGKLVFSYEAEWVNLLPRYPDDITEEERQRLEPALRATFNVLAGMPLRDADDEPRGLRWAKSFWRQNWSLYGCIRPATTESEDSSSTEERTPWATALTQWAGDVEALESKFLLAERSVEPDLYSPDRHEVLTGITYRHLRAVAMMVRFPGYWTMEHGSPTLRNLVESRIILKWLVKQDDPDLYGKFKDYGRGRVKLLLLHLREYRDEMEDPPQELVEQVEYLDAFVNQEMTEEFQDISIERNFANKNVRDMAKEVGLTNDYHFVFAPTSSNLHGEWGPLDQFVLAPCGNSLHRGHRIPNTDPSLVVGPGIVESALTMLAALVDDYCEAVGFPDGNGFKGNVPSE
ncbi:DUF5677 domain-containing protein [Kocuria rosea]|uniref:DUF5677 domain-containing protein n=1 Tax=Kocuria rosea TaxID=1275 RepID=UPI0025426442|nr:DUF5677 domain-containing protein [Kocuria rosea]WIG18395.1 DUF5677 domain-containing protein [Kocuria rosea]